MAHLDAVHRATIVAGGEPSAWLERLLSWTQHEWAIEWRPMEEVEGKEALKHCSQVRLHHKMTLFGKLNLLNLKVPTLIPIAQFQYKFGLFNTDLSGGVFRA